MNELISLNDKAKVWIYQGDRVLTNEELKFCRPLIEKFVIDWVSHSKDLKAFGDIFHRRFLVLMVDETQVPASGCSIDHSVHFVEQLGRELNVDFFGRMNFAYLRNEKVEIIRMDQMENAYNTGQIDSETLMFDNLIKTKEEFINNWLKPLEDSWHWQFVS